MFVGEYEHVIDAKRRLAIPAEVRDMFNPEEHGGAFYASPGSEHSLKLYPERQFKIVMNNFSKNPKFRKHKRSIFSQSARVPMDSAGRVRIPERLLSEHGLSGKVVVLGMNDHLEVTSADRWTRDRANLERVSDEIWDQAIEDAMDEMDGNES